MSSFITNIITIGCRRQKLQRIFPAHVVWCLVLAQGFTAACEFFTWSIQFWVLGWSLKIIRQWMYLVRMKIGDSRETFEMCMAVIYGLKLTFLVRVLFTWERAHGGVQCNFTTSLNRETFTFSKLGRAFPRWLCLANLQWIPLRLAFELFQMAPCHRNNPPQHVLFIANLRIE